MGSWHLLLHFLLEDWNYKGIIAPTPHLLECYRCKVLASCLCAKCLRRWIIYACLGIDNLDKETGIFKSKSVHFTLSLIILEHWSESEERVHIFSVILTSIVILPTPLCWNVFSRGMALKNKSQTHTILLNTRIMCPTNVVFSGYFNLLLTHFWFRLQTLLLFVVLDSYLCYNCSVYWKIEIVINFLVLFPSQVIWSVRNTIVFLFNQLKPYYPHSPVLVFWPPSHYHIWPWLFIPMFYLVFHKLILNSAAGKIPLKQRLVHSTYFLRSSLRHLIS